MSDGIQRGGINYEFASDNTAPAAPEILDAVAAANTGHVLSYGADPWTERLHALASKVFGVEVVVVPILSGKLANHLSLAAFTNPGGVIFCHEHAHILIDEYGGPAFVTGCRLIGLPGDGDKITPDTLRTAISQELPMPDGSVLSLTNVTEAGTIYAPEETAELTAIARDAGLPVHLDGARIANAAAALGCSLAALTIEVGIDILSLGTTKNGGLGAEAVVLFEPLASDRLREKQLLFGHEPSKMRFLSAQLIAWLEYDSWRARAAHANAAALRLAVGLGAIPGIELVQPVEANLIFAAVAADVKAHLDDASYFVYPMDMPGFGDDVVRFATSWATTEDAIDRLLATLSGSVQTHSVGVAATGHV
jgi:threonine aldolase